eukprot:271148-Amphidinium_carterae.1
MGRRLGYRGSDSFLQRRQRESVPVSPPPMGRRLGYQRGKGAAPPEMGKGAAPPEMGAAEAAPPANARPAMLPYGGGHRRPVPPAVPPRGTA